MTDTSLPEVDSSSNRLLNYRGKSDQVDLQQMQQNRLLSETEALEARLNSMEY